MKRILLILALAVIGTAMAMAESMISFTGEKKHDFGTIKENDGPVVAQFQFTNTGDTPLVIVSATATCGCTHPKYPTDPIKPGDTGIIRVTYLPKGRPGEFDKSVKVRTNAKNAKKVTLKISGVVVP